MTFPEFILLLISVFASVAGQFLLKAGAIKLGAVTTENIITHVLAIVNIPELLIGLSCYGIGAIAYILLLTRVDLSIAAPSISLVYVFSVLLSYLIFHEIIPITRIIGLGFIILGIVLVVYKQ